MASVITSNTGSGLALQPDNSGQLQFSTGYGGIQLSLANNVLTMGSTVNVAMGSNSVMTMGDASQFMTSKSFGMRNRLINGAMEIDQRRSGASYTASLGQLNYGVDRWFIYPTGATLTGQQVAGTNTGTPYAFRITGNTGSTGCNFGQRVENLNTDDLSSTQVTFRVLIYASTAITGVSLYALSPTATNNYASTTTSFSTGVTVNSGLNIITVTATLNSTANLGQEFGIAFGNGIASGVSVDISYAQAEVGSVATPFERRQYGQELALCQRYYQSFASTDVSVSAITTQAAVFVPFVVQMRTIPTATYPYSDSTYNSSPSSGQWCFNVGYVSNISKTGTITTAATVLTTWAKFFFYGMTLSSVPTGIGSNNQSNITFSAEL